MKKVVKKAKKKVAKKAKKSSGEIIFQVAREKDGLRFKVNCSHSELTDISQEAVTMLLTGKPSCL